MRERLARLLVWLLRKVTKNTTKEGTFHILMMDDVVGVLEWHISQDYAQNVEQYKDKDDPGFVDHHLRTFLLMLLAVLTAKNPNIKHMHKDVIRRILVDYQEKMKENYPAKN